MAVPSESSYRTLAARRRHHLVYLIMCHRSAGSGLLEMEKALTRTCPDLIWDDGKPASRICFRAHGAHQYGRPLLPQSEKSTTTGMLQGTRETRFALIELEALCLLARAKETRAETGRWTLAGSQHFSLVYTGSLPHFGPIKVERVVGRSFAGHSHPFEPEVLGFIVSMFQRRFTEVEHDSTVTPYLWHTG